MSFPEDSVQITVPYCPGCQPERDPSAELIHVLFCYQHIPSVEGDADQAIRSSYYLTGSNEAGGDSNRRFCDFIHRKKLYHD